MTTVAASDWRKEFGIDGRKPPNLFTSKDQMSPSTPQAHLLRRAFDVLKVDGILCVDHSPLAYFKLVKRITSEAVYELHKRFWNHSGASLLVLISDDCVHVYSGMTKPTPVTDGQGDLPSLVTPLSRIADGLKKFVIAVESGEFFHQYHPSFDPAQRVDRDLLDNLQSTRAKLDDATETRIPADVLDALLCRLVFTGYLFDRKVIGENYLIEVGISGATDLRSLLGISSRTKAKDALYNLFKKLKVDFNGDLFSNDLDAEKRLIQDDHINILNDFFEGTNVITGQKSFWPYDFEFIPIETISAIYERFLKAADERKGAFYTPRFLAEVVLDTALDGIQSLIGKRFFDPACGSGIFLVGLFNRIAEEWTQANPSARNDRKSKELMRLLQESIFGVDISLTACRITAFSLYLAYLDQLSPPDIQALQKKGRALPGLVVSNSDCPVDKLNHGNIREADFFAEGTPFPHDVSLVIGNPPWGSIATEDTAAGRWCVANTRPLPDNQIAAAFIWKAATHTAVDGRVCLVLPHGILFNHSTTAVPFQMAWVKSHSIQRVINLADLRFLLFKKAIHPAVVVSYSKEAPAGDGHPIEYWTPKADWIVTQAEVITIAPQDRTSVTVAELLRDLASPDAPQIWKRRYWATPRDWRLLDRLSQYPRLRDHVRQTKEKHSTKPWLIAQGFQPLGPGDKADDSKTIELPSRAYIGAQAEAFNLFLLRADCETLPSKTVRVRGRSGVGTDIFRAPHVLVTRGFSSHGFSGCAYADFDVAFRSSVRGIHGPATDSALLMFLTAFLRSSLATYFLIHTSSSLGIYRPEVHDKDLLQLPFPFPDEMPQPARSWDIVRKVAGLVTKATATATSNFLTRENQVQTASAAIETLVHDYFDLLPLESALVEDTAKVTVPSIQPTLNRMPTQTVRPATASQCEAYCDRVCGMLNGWSKRSGFIVQGHIHRSESLGIGVAVLEKTERQRTSKPLKDTGDDILRVLDKVRKSISQKYSTLDVVRGVMVFENNRLYMVKPIGQRFWTQTAAMNDADEIAGTILMRSPQRNA